MACHLLEVDLRNRVLTSSKPEVGEPWSAPGSTTEHPEDSRHDNITSRTAYKERRLWSVRPSNGVCAIVGHPSRCPHQVVFGCQQPEIRHAGLQMVTPGDRRTAVL
jgi:hypothetical protein